MQNPSISQTLARFYFIYFWSELFSKIGQKAKSFEETMMIKRQKVQRVLINPQPRSLFLFKIYQVEVYIYLMGFPGGASGKEAACQCRRHKRHGFNPWVRKIPWRRAWQPTPVFLPGESHGQRSLVGYSAWGRKKSDMKKQLSTHARRGILQILFFY